MPTPATIQVDADGLPVVWVKRMAGGREFIGMYPALEGGRSAVRYPDGHRTRFTTHEAARKAALACAIVEHDYPATPTTPAEASPTRAQLTAAIEATVRRYLADGLAGTAYDINDGQCEDLATDVAEALGGENERFEGTWADNLTVGGRGAEWDVDLIMRLSPLSEPPHELTWDEANAGIPAHYWLMLDGRHYDAECPEGVNNLFELPILRREMERLAETRPDPSGMAI